MYNSSMKLSIGEKVKLARQEVGLTQKQLSDRLKCTEVMVSRYELGAVPLSVERLEQIAVIVGKPLGYFFTDGDEANASNAQNDQERSAPKRAFVFDLDDTLVDGRKFCGETIARSITSQVPAADFDLICQIHDSVRGMAIEDLYVTILKDLGIKADIKKLLAYDKVIQQENIQRMKLFDGVIEMLQLLKQRGRKLYICTNRSKVLLNKVLEYNGISAYFDEIISCADAGYKKPNPYCLSDLINRIGIPPKEFIYFGDSEVDSQFAQNAGIEHIIFDQYMNNNNLFQKLINMFLV